MMDKYDDPNWKLGVALDTMARGLITHCEEFGMEFYPGGGFHMHFTPRMAAYWIRALRASLERIGMAEEFPMPADDYAPRVFSMLREIAAGDDEGMPK